MPQPLAIARTAALVAALVAASACSSSAPDPAAPAAAPDGAPPDTASAAPSDAAASALSLDAALAKLGDDLPRELDGKPRAFFLEALIASRCAETRPSISAEARPQALAALADRYGWTPDALKAAHSQHASAVSKLAWVTRAMDDARCAHYPLQLDADAAQAAALSAPDDALAGFVRGDALQGTLDLTIAQGAISGTLALGDLRLPLKGSARGRVFTATADQGSAKLLIEGRVEEGDRARGVVRGALNDAPVQAPFVAAR